MQIHARFHACENWTNGNNHERTLCGRQKHVLFLLTVGTFWYTLRQAGEVSHLPLCRHCAYMLRKRQVKNG